MQLSASHLVRGDVAGVLGRMTEGGRLGVSSDGWTGTLTVLDVCHDTGRVTIDALLREQRGHGLVRATMNGRLARAGNRRVRVVVSADVRSARPARHDVERLAAALTGFVSSLDAPPGTRRPLVVPASGAALVLGAVAFGVAARHRRRGGR